MRKCIGDTANKEAAIISTEMVAASNDFHLFLSNCTARKAPHLQLSN